jgi:hypothetical protein
MKFPCVIRLDGSDPRVYAHAADPGEPAVTGTFAFADADPESLSHGERLAFAGGWLGTQSFGRATLVEVAEIAEADFFQTVERLARHFVDAYGAPSLSEALPVARAECDDAAQLCDHPVHTLLAIEREPSEAGVRERIKVIQPSRAEEHAKIWELGEDADGS